MRRDNKINKWEMFIALLWVVISAPSSIRADELGDINQVQKRDISGDISLEEKPLVVFLISEDPDNYEAHTTIPTYAEMLARDQGFKVTVIQGRGPRNAFEFPGLDVLTEADLVIVFFRRVALPHGQLDAIKNYLRQGNPLVGIRTANHAFDVREGNIPEGYQDWQDFVPDILGCENRGYGSTELGTMVTIAPRSEGHPILEGFDSDPWHSEGNIYIVAPLIDQKAVILLTGTAGDKTEPIAWTRKAGESRIFYTSLGYPKDFEVPRFRRLLTNGIRWALDME